jgi:hypothetical protein
VDIGVYQCLDNWLNFGCSYALRGDLGVNTIELIGLTIVAELVIIGLQLVTLWRLSKN